MTMTRAIHDLSEAIDSLVYTHPDKRGYVIGFHAPRGAGKDTTANRLSFEMRRSFGMANVVAFADPIYEAISALTGLPVVWLKDQANKERVLNSDDTAVRTLHGKTIRHMLEQMGTEFVRNNLAYDHFVELMRVKISAESAPVWHFVTDVRFPNETPLCDLVIELRRAGDVGYSDDHQSRKRLPEAFIDATYTLTTGDTSSGATGVFVTWLNEWLTSARALNSKGKRKERVEQMEARAQEYARKPFKTYA